MEAEPLKAIPLAYARLSAAVSAALLAAAVTLSAARLRFLETPAAMFLAFVGVALVAGVFGLARASWVDRLGVRAFAGLLSSLVLVPRIAWVLLVRAQPTDDFLLYHRYAAGAARGLWHDIGPVFPVFPFKLSYPLLLAFPYRWFGPEPIVAAFVNVALSVVLAWQVWRLARLVGGEPAGRRAALLFAAWPAQIYFCAVVGQEHLFAVPLLEAAIVLLSIDAQAPRLLVRAGWFGALLAMAHFIRSIGVLIAPAIVIYAGLFAWRGRAGAWSRRGRFLGVAAVAAAFTFAVLTVPIGRWLGVPLWRSSCAFSLLVGTDAEARGMWTPKVGQFVNDQGWDSEAIDREASRIVRERLREPGAITRLFARKFGAMWGADGFGIYFSTASLPEGDPTTARVRSLVPLFHGLGDAFHTGLMLLVLIAMVRSWRSPAVAAPFVEALFLVHVAAFTFLELQTRYHFLITPFWVALAATAFARRNEGASA